MLEEPERLRVFLDADVLVAGSASPTGASHFVLRLGELGLVDAVASTQVRIEVERNLAKKLPAALPAFRLLAGTALHFVEDPDPATLEALRGETHPKDAPILGAAIMAGCQALITVNVRHFSPTPGRIVVETPAEFVSRLRRILARALAGER